MPNWSVSPTSLTWTPGVPLSTYVILTVNLPLPLTLKSIAYLGNYPKSFTWSSSGCAVGAVCKPGEYRVIVTFVPGNNPQPPTGTLVFTDTYGQVQKVQLTGFIG